MGPLLSTFVLAASLDAGPTTAEITRLDFAEAFAEARDNPLHARDPVAIGVLVRYADELPAGVQRDEAWMFAANSYAQRLDRPDDAIPLYRRVAADPSDPVLAHAALDAVVELHLGRGDLAGARVDVALLPDPRVEAIVQRAVRRHYVHLASIFAIVVTLALAVRGRRRDFPRAWPVALGFSAFVGGGGALLASTFSAGSATPFVYFAAALVPLIGVALVWRSGPRALRAGACAASVLATAFLVLERCGQLDGLGL